MVSIEKGLNMNNKLKNCPFCGEKGYLKEISPYTRGDYDKDTIYHVSCVGCQECQIEYTNKDQAIKAWNSRCVPEDILSNINLIQKVKEVLELFLEKCELSGDGKSSGVITHAKPEVYIKAKEALDEFNRIENESRIKGKQLLDSIMKLKETTNGN